MLSSDIYLERTGLTLPACVSVRERGPVGSLGAVGMGARGDWQRHGTASARLCLSFRALSLPYFCNSLLKDIAVCPSLQMRKLRA